MRLRLKNKGGASYSIPLLTIVFSVLIIGGGFFTASIYTIVQQRVDRQADLKFNEITSGYVDRLFQRLETYGDALYATRGLFAATKVDAKTWERFVHSQSSPDRYDGLKAIGYAEIVPSGKIKAYEQILQKQHKDIKIHPKKASGEHVILTYHQTISLPAVRPEDILGFDLASDKARFNALEKARKTGSMAVSGPINILSTKSPGALMILPLTSRFEGTNPASVPFGYGIAAFEFPKLIESAIDSRLQPQTSVSVKDVTDGQSTQLFSKSVKHSGSTETQDVTIRVADRTWKLTFRVSKSSLLNPGERLAPAAVLTFGIGFILILCILSYALRLRRRLKFTAYLD